MPRLTVLVADDDDRHRAMLCVLLHDWGYNTLEAQDGVEAIDQARKGADLALVDVRMPNMDGLTALPEIKKARPEMPVVMMTAYSDVAAAVEAMRNGAWDYLAKPLDFAKLQITVSNATEKLAKSDKAIEDKNTFPLIGESAAMREFAGMLKTVAPSEATLLILGESGTGKELAARAAHAASKRAGGPFVAINCGAFSENLLASELFGHEKGAFTGADKKHAGLFRQARGGSIFLDEIGEMPLPMQVKLLRVLQEKEVLPVGGVKPEPVDCRVIAATNRDLTQEVAEGRFREDLYYRLNVVSLNMPPLRDRNGDVLLLANTFAQRLAKMNGKRFLGIAARAQKALENWRWPGNVRELENVMERAIILMPGEYISERELPQNIMAAENNRESPISGPDMALPELRGNEITSQWPTLEAVEKKVILETLRRYGNNKTETAKALGITRKTLHAKLNKYKEDGG